MPSKNSRKRKSAGGDKQSPNSSSNPKRQKTQGASSSSSSSSSSSLVPVHDLNVSTESTSSESSSSREQYQEALVEVNDDIQATKQEIAQYKKKIEGYETKRENATNKEEEEKYTRWIKEAKDDIASCEAKLARLGEDKKHYLKELKERGGGSAASSSEEQVPVRRSAVDILNEIEVELRVTEPLFNAERLLERNLSEQHHKIIEPQGEVQNAQLSVLIGPSGCGKTRHLYETLYGKLGYYLVVNKLSNGGSLDLAQCILCCENNPTDTEFALLCLVVARVWVCSRIPQDPQLVLSAQLHPIGHFGYDVFAWLFGKLYESATLLSVRNCLLNMKREGTVYSKFFVDEIQHALKTQLVFPSPKSSALRPFFSPLVRFTQVYLAEVHTIISGTGISLNLLNELLTSSALKPERMERLYVKTYYDAGAVCRYAQIILEDHYTDEVRLFLTSFDLVCGRPRFVATFLEGLAKKNYRISAALEVFEAFTTDVDTSSYPLRYIRERFPKKVAYTSTQTLYGTMQDLLAEYDVFGKGEMRCGADTTLLEAGLGYLDREKFTLREPLVARCLRNHVETEDLVRVILGVLQRAPNNVASGLFLEQLVAYAFAKRIFNSNVRLQYVSLPVLLEQKDDDACGLPENQSGPDVVFIQRQLKILRLLQVKFVRHLYRQDRAHAVATTDIQQCYTQKSGEVIRGFEARRNRALQAADGFENVQRYLFVHPSPSNVNAPEYANVTLICQATCADFFNVLDLQADVYGILTHVHQLNNK